MDGGVTPVAIFTGVLTCARNTAGARSAVAAPAINERKRRRNMASPHWPYSAFLFSHATPRRDLAFDSMNQVRDRDADDRENHDRHEQFGCPERVAVQNDHVAESGKRR